MDARTKIFLAGASVSFLACGFLTYVGLRDARVLTAGLLIAAVGPMFMTVAKLESYLPRAYAVRTRELWNVPLGIPLGIAVYYIWQVFPTMYAAVEEIVWRPSEGAGGAYLEGMQIALDTAGGYFLGLILGALLLGAQLFVWIAPAYLLAKMVTQPVEKEVERYYRQKIRQSTRKVVGRPTRLTKFKVGGDLAETKVQLRMYGTALSIFSGLIAMTLLAWLAPLL